MEHLFGKCFFIGGFAIIPRWAVRRWRRQIATPYSALSEEEKEADRQEADRVLDVWDEAWDRIAQEPYG